MLALTLTALLTGCGHTIFDRLACPDVVQYSAKTQDAAAAEVMAGQAPALTEMVKDYGVMRDQSRACAGK